ncbi:MAG: exosortase U [Rubripirellula sp.]
MNSDESLARISRQLDELNHPGDKDSWLSNSSGIRLWIVCLIPTLPLLLVYLWGSVRTAPLAYIPLAFLLVGLLYRSRADSPVGRPKKKAGWIPIGIGLFAVLMAVLLSYPWFSAFGFVCIAGSLLRSVRGRLRRNLTYLTAPLISILVPPFQIDDLIVNWAHRKTTWIASIFLDFLEIPHAIDGSVIQLFELEVLASEVNGGFLSIFCLFFIACSLMAWKRVSLWLLPAYAIAVLATTILINASRVTFHIFAIESLEIDEAVSWLPTAAAVTSGIAAIAILYSFHHLITAFFHFVEPNQDANVNPIVQGFNKLSYMNDNRAFEEMSHLRSRENRDEVASIAKPAWLGLLGIGALLALLSVVQVFRSPVVSDDKLVATKALLSPDEDFFATVKIQAAEITSHSLAMTEQGNAPELRSDSWEGTFGEAQLKIQITQPLVGWWELSNGYRQVGWEVLDRDTVVATEDGDVSDEDVLSKPFVYARLRQQEPELLQSYLFFSSVDEQGKIGAAPTGFESLLKRLKRRMGFGNRDAAVAMIQMWVVSKERLSSSDLLELRLAFVKYRSVLSDALASTKVQVGIPDKIDIDSIETTFSNELTP